MVDRESTTEEGRESSGASDEAPILTLEVRPNDRRGGWEVVAAGSREALFVEKERWTANGRAINHLSENGGGEVLELSPEGRVIGHQAVPGALGREEILQLGREICEAESTPLVDAETAVQFDVPEEELEFAAALWRVCSESRGAAWKETDLGFVFQYGPYVLLNRYSGRYVLEKFDSTAAAMRRFSEVGRDELATIQTGLLVVEKLEVRNHAGKKFTLKPGEFLQRGVRGNYAAFSPGWVEVVDLTREQLKRLRPVCVVKRDLEIFFVAEADALVFEQLTGEKFLDG